MPNVCGLRDVCVGSVVVVLLMFDMLAVVSVLSMVYALCIVSVLNVVLKHQLLLYTTNNFYYQSTGHYWEKPQYV